MRPQIHGLIRVSRSILALSLLTTLLAADSSLARDAAQLVIANVRVYPSPYAPAIDRAWVVVRDGRIHAIHKDSDRKAPPAEQVVDGQSLSLLAGFWNCHVHFTEEKWNGAAQLPDEVLAKHLRAMLLRHGFTSVVDTGSFFPNTQAIRQRIATGVVAGPRILTTSSGFVPVDGSPAYLTVQLPELRSPGQAAELSRSALSAGADAIKLFTGSFLGPERVALMPIPIVRAVTEAAHQQEAVVIAHPQSIGGVRAAVRGGVDVLAHTAPSTGPWDVDLDDMLRSGIALVPTLSLWRWELTRLGLPRELVENYERTAVAQLRSFAAAGGTVLFGTDVGYMTEYDPAAEFRLMEMAGLGFREILGALTTNPTARFGDSELEGTVEVGKRADLVLVRGEPERDVRAFTMLAHAIRSGRVVFSDDGR